MNPGLFELASQLLFSNLDQTTGNMTPDCAGVPGSHMTVVPVLGDSDSKLLGHFIFQLIQSLIRLGNHQYVAATGLSCSHVLFTSFTFWYFYCVRMRKDHNRERMEGGLYEKGAGGT